MKNIIIVIVLGVLVLISIVQALQLNDMKNKLSGVSVGTSSASIPTASGGSSGSGASLPANIQNLPSMVGGC